MVLTEDEIRFFKREGYLVKKGALDPELCARAREPVGRSAAESEERRSGFVGGSH